jgi:transposase
MRQPNDLSRSLAPFDQDTTLIAVIEMSQSSWLVAGIVPGLERHPLKKLAVDERSLLRLLKRGEMRQSEQAAGSSALRRV